MSYNNGKLSFYSALWYDYKTVSREKGLEHTYIYQYLKDKKDVAVSRVDKKERMRMRNAGRLDVYVYVQSLFLAYEEKEVTKEELLRRLTEIIHKKKNLSSFSTAINKSNQTDRELVSLRDKILQQCLKKDIQIFFNDLGYVEKMGDGEFPEEDKIRKQDDMLDLYFGFSAKNEKLQEKEEDSFDELHLEECKKLFSALRKDENCKDAFLPVEINAQTGMGIFIIGSEYLGIEKEDTCYYGILLFDVPLGAEGLNDMEKKEIVSLEENIIFQSDFRVVAAGKTMMAMLRIMSC